MPMSGCRNLHVDLGSSLIITIFFLFADLLARGTLNQSSPQIRRITIIQIIFYLSIQPKKTYLNYDRIGDHLF